VPALLLNPPLAISTSLFHPGDEEQMHHLVLTLIPIVNEENVASQSRQLEVSVDSDGFIVLTRDFYRASERKINLRRDARFEHIESVKDLYDRYMLELKLRRKTKR
jgi:hypothetical protein